MLNLFRKYFRTAPVIETVPLAQKAIYCQGCGRDLYGERIFVSSIPKKMRYPVFCSEDVSCQRRFYGEMLPPGTKVGGENFMPEETMAVELPNDNRFLCGRVAGSGKGAIDIEVTVID